MLTNDITHVWTLYERGREYNTRIHQYKTVDTNTEFFAGNQWLNIPNTPAMRGLPKPTFNIIKRIICLQVASVMGSSVAVHVEPLADFGLPGMGPEITSAMGPEMEMVSPDVGSLSAANGDGLNTVGDGLPWPGTQSEQYSQAANPFTDSPDPTEMVQSAIDNLWEKTKMDYLLRDALFDGAITGDFCIHNYFDPDAIPYGGALDGGLRRGEIRVELIDGINVMFGNPNETEVEKQPYILIVGRDTVDRLNAEKAKYQKRPSGPADVQSDTETQNFPGIGGRTEIIANDETAKALYVIMYSKKNGTVHVTKSTRSVIIYEDIDTGLTLYPIAWGHWQRQKNQYHGRSLATEIIPNQIFINSSMATAMRHLQLMAFPKILYNANLIPVWTNEVGQAIPVRNLPPGDSLAHAATTISAPEMSGQILTVIDRALNMTKECLGATDVQMGNVRAENTSALLVLHTNAEVPLENVRANLHAFAEDMVRIWVDMMGTYYKDRPVVAQMEMDEMTPGPGGFQTDPQTGLFLTQTAVKKVPRIFQFDTLKNAWFNLRVDIGAGSYYSELAMTETLNHMFEAGLLDTIQYLERVPDKMIPQKHELIRELRSKFQPAAPGTGVQFPEGGLLDNNRQAGNIPSGVAAALAGLPGQVDRIANRTKTA